MNKERSQKKNGVMKTQESQNLEKEKVEHATGMSTLRNEGKGNEKMLFVSFSVASASPDPLQRGRGVDRKGVCKG